MSVDRFLEDDKARETRRPHRCRPVHSTATSWAAAVSKSKKSDDIWGFLLNSALYDEPKTQEQMDELWNNFDRILEFLGDPEYRDTEQADRFRHLLKVVFRCHRASIEEAEGRA